MFVENVGKIDYDLNQNRELIKVFMKIGGLIRFFKFNCELVYTCSNLMRIINYHEKWKERYRNVSDRRIEE